MHKAVKGQNPYSIQTHLHMQWQGMGRTYEHISCCDAEDSFALTHFQRMWTQEPATDLVTRLGLGHIKPRMSLSQPFNPCCYCLVWERPVCVSNCTRPSRHGIAKYLLCAHLACVDCTVQFSSRCKWEKHVAGSTTMAVWLPWFIWPTFSPLPLLCAWFGERGGETTRQEAAGSTA